MHRQRLRALVVALVITSGVTTAGQALLADLARQADSVRDAQDAIVALCSAALLGAVAWLGLAGLAVVIEVWRGASASTRPPRAVPAVVRRAVLLCCGVAVTGSVLVSPAYAEMDAITETPQSAHRSGVEAVSGLPLPTRTSDADPRRVRPVGPTEPPAARHLVVAGESLWSVAADLHPAGTPTDEIARTATVLWRTNQEVLGADPDLIYPGQVLELPHVPVAQTHSEGQP